MGLPRGQLPPPEPGQPLPAWPCVALSPDGGDANRYREFDVETRSFVDPAAGGFDLPTAKGNASWLDADTLLVATTAEGLPRDRVLLRTDRREAAPRPVAGRRLPGSSRSPRTT